MKAGSYKSIVRCGRYGRKRQLDPDRVCGCKVGGVMRVENHHAWTALVGGDLRVENHHAGPIGSYSTRKHGSDPGPLRNRDPRMRTGPSF